MSNTDDRRRTRLKSVVAFAVGTVIFAALSLAVWRGTRTTDEERAERITESAVQEMRLLTEAIGFEIAKTTSALPLRPAKPFEFSRESNWPQGRNGYVIVTLQGPPDLSADASLAQAFGEALDAAGYEVVDVHCQDRPVELLLAHRSKNIGATAVLESGGDVMLRIDTGPDYRLVPSDELTFFPRPGDCWPLKS